MGISMIGKRCFDTNICYIAIVLVGTAMSFIITELFYMRDRVSSTNIYTGLFNTITTNLENRIKNNLEPSVLSRALDLFDVSVDQFSDMASVASVAHEIEGITLAVRVPLWGIGRFEDEAFSIYNNTIKIVDGEFKPIVEYTEEYLWPIIYEYFALPPMKSLLGLNMYGEPIRKNFDEMVDTKTIVVSNPVVFTDTGKLGLLVMQPISKGGGDIIACLVRGIRPETLFSGSEVDTFIRIYDSRISMYFEREGVENVIYSTDYDNIIDTSYGLCEHVHISQKSQIVLCTCPPDLHFLSRIDHSTYFITITIGIIVTIAFSIIIKTAQVMADSYKQSRIKSKFIADVSHEIRTPINGIMGMSELLYSQDMSIMCKDYVRDILSCGKTLSKIVSDVLDMTNIEEETVKVILHPICLRSVIYDAIYTTWCIYNIDHVDNGNVILSLKISPDIPNSYINGDSTKITQIVSNLVSNSLKFTDMGSIIISVYVKCTVGRKMSVCIDVTDTGIGMDKESVSRIFKPFTRFDSSRYTSGTGLGLYISRKLVSLMNGTITCKSIPNKGTSLSVIIQIDLPENVKPGRNFVNHIFNIENKRDRPEETKCESYIDVDTCTSIVPNILIVDDNRINRLVASKMLIEMGTNTCTAIHGKEAVEMCKAKKFSMIVMDMVMPVMNGIDATREIRQGTSLNKHTPIVFSSATIDPDSVESCLLAGGNSFMAKPISKDMLYKRLIDHLSKNEITHMTI